MFIRQCFRTKNGKRHAYWALVESYRSERGPRQRVVAWLGRLDEQGRLGVRKAADDHRRQDKQQSLFAEPEPQWVEVDAAAVRVENCRQFGGPWLALELIKKIGLDQFLKKHLAAGRESVPWPLTSMLLVVARLCQPSSELFIAEQWLPKTVLPELLGVPRQRVDDNRLYRALDQLLPLKEQLEAHLKDRLGTLFDLEYDLLLYDVTSTFFEGEANGNPLAQRGYSRDQRPDCKQVNIGLVVSRCGMPLGYEVFAGNTADVTTVQQIVETMEARYGRAQRVWVMDRGMVSEENIRFLRHGGRRYIVGTPKSMLRKFEAELLKSDWNAIRDGLQVKLCTMPRDEDAADTSAEHDPGRDQPEVFILCRSQDRRAKEEAMVRKSAEKIRGRLESMSARCQRQQRDPMKVEREVGRLLGQNTRAARLFEVTVGTAEDGRATLTWKPVKARQDFHALSSGCYILRSNVTDWSDEDLWKAYIQLTEAEAAFGIHKSDLKIRPVWHQKQDRVLAHILVCFLAYVLWKTLAGLCRRSSLGDEPRRVLDELSELRSMDVVLPTRNGPDIRKHCISRPSEHQAILLDQLDLKLPGRISQIEM
jgi:transposase